MWAGLSPVPVQMWAGGEPSPDADVDGAEGKKKPRLRASERTKYSALLAEIESVKVRRADRAAPRRARSLAPLPFAVCRVLHCVCALCRVTVRCRSADTGSAVRRKARGACGIMLHRARSLLLVACCLLHGSIHSPVGAHGSKSAKALRRKAARWRWR